MSEIMEIDKSTNIQPEDSFSACQSLSQMLASSCADSGKVQNITIKLHPLVILGISEHFMRLSHPTKDAFNSIHESQSHSNAHSTAQNHEDVVGLLLGVHHSTPYIEISKILEMHFDDVYENEGEAKGHSGSCGGATPRKLNLEFMEARLAQSAQVDPQLEVIGWYSIGAQPSPTDFALNEQLEGGKNLFMLLKLDAKSATNAAVAASSFESNKQQEFRMNKFPVHIYESINAGSASADADMPRGASSSLSANSPPSSSSVVSVRFRPVQYELTQEETEAIGVKHVSNSRLSAFIPSSSTTSSSAAAALTENSSANQQQQQNAAQLKFGQSQQILHPQMIVLHMLTSRINTLMRYIEAVQTGRLPRDDAIIAQIRALLLNLSLASPLHRESDQQQDGKGEAKQQGSQFYAKCNDVALSCLLNSLCSQLAKLHRLQQCQEVASLEHWKSLRMSAAAANMASFNAMAVPAGASGSASALNDITGTAAAASNLEALLSGSAPFDASSGSATAGTGGGSGGGAWKISNIWQNK